MTHEPRDPFLVDVERALEALGLTWQDEYDELSFYQGSGWGAHHKDAPEDDIILASTPDELDAKLRQDWSRRHGGQP